MQRFLWMSFFWIFSLVLLLASSYVCFQFLLNNVFFLPVNFSRSVSLFTSVWYFLVLSSIVLSVSPYLLWHEQVTLYMITNVLKRFKWLVSNFDFSDKYCHPSMEVTEFNRLFLNTLRKFTFREKQRNCFNGWFQNWFTKVWKRPLDSTFSRSNILKQIPHSNISYSNHVTLRHSNR